MSNEPELREWIEEKSPTLFSLLNQKARRHLPSGLIAFLSGQWTDNGKDLLVAADKRAEQLVDSCGVTAVGDSYRRDLSGVADEKQEILSNVVDERGQAAFS